MVSLLDRVLPVLLIVAVASYPLDPYRLLGTNLSLYRIVSVSFVLLTLARVFLGGRIHNNVLIVLIVLFLGYLAARYTPLNSHTPWGVSKFRAYLFGGVFALSISQGRNVIKPGILGLQISLWVTAPFVGFTVYEFLVNGRIITALPALPGFGVSTDGWLAQRHSFEGIVRLAAPFPTPPFLGLLGAVCAVATWWQILHATSPTLRGTVWRQATMGLAVLIVVASMSRSAALPAVAWCVLLLIGYEVRSRRRRKRRLSMLAGVAGSGLLILLVVAWTPALRDIAAVGLQRAASPTSSVTRHVETRLTAVRVWLVDTRSTLIGTGFGEYGASQAARGEPHSHSPYTTLLAEAGVVGVALLITLLFVALGRLVIQARAGNADAAVLFAVLSMLSAAFALYEFLALQFVWALIGLAASVRKNESGPLAPPIAST